MKIFKAFMWFSTTVAISSVTMISVFFMKDHLVDDVFSFWAGMVFIFFIMVAGIYWAYQCLENMGDVFKKRVVKDDI